MRCTRERPSGLRGPCANPTMDELGLERSEEALDHSVVPAVGLTTHSGRDLPS